MENLPRVKSTKNDFTNVDLPKMIFNSSHENKYKVYSNPDDFIIIVADNASNAIEQSKIEKPYKIEHVIEDLIYIIDKEELTKQNPSN